MEYKTIIKKQIFENEKKAKDLHKIKSQLEQECRSYEQQLHKESVENFENKMTLEKTRVFTELNTERYERDSGLLNKYKERKIAEETGIRESRESANKDYLGMEELQRYIKEGEQYKKEIEEMHCELQYLSIKIKELEDATEYLEEKKDELDDQKKATEEQNEELEKTWKAKEEANKKRLIGKLQKDKNPQIKELIAKEEEQTENNENFSTKLREEKEKLDILQDELVQLKETLFITTQKYEETLKKVEVQREELDQKREIIEEKQKSVNTKLKDVEQMRKINNFEQEKNKAYEKKNAALKAKLQFIESKYDYTSSAKSIQIDYLKNLIETNLNVNTTVEEFKTKLAVIKKEIQNSEAMKSMIM